MGWIALFAAAVIASYPLYRFVRHFIDKRVAERTAHLVSERDAALEEARTANGISASKSEFLANMSHEIRTPLNSMVGTTELLLESSLNNHHKNQLRTVLSSAESLLRIISDILDLSKIESGRFTLECTPFDVRAVIREVVEQFHVRLQESNRKQKVDLVIDIDPGLPAMVMGDSVRVHQLLNNLISNAIKFTSKGHIIFTAAATTGSDTPQLVFTVADTGIGIARDKLESVFDKFAQAEGGATTRQFGGTGLGLTICRQLVTLMQGRLDVQSAYGKGSIFTITLPLAPAEEQAVSDAGLPDFSGRRALIVDDCEASTNVLRRYLAQIGIRTLVSDNPQAAQYTLRTADECDIAIDTVFIEHRLAESSGIELVSRLRREMQGRPMTIIGMGLLDDAHVVRAFARAGCDGFLHKPIFAEQLGTLFQLIDKHGHSFVDLSAFSEDAADRDMIDYPDYHAFAVLLVEDNRINRELALEMLAKFHIEAESAENGVEALAIASTRKFDLILMDCQMPQMDGFEASRLLRERMRLGEIADTPIIALTANAMKGDREQCLEAGMNDYLSKPLRLQEMRAMLSRWLDQAKREAA